MGVGYKLKYDRCELFIHERDLDQFIKTHSDFMRHEFSNPDLAEGSYWLSELLGVFGGFFDFHINRTKDGILIDDLVIAGEDRMHEKYLEYTKDIFKEYGGSLWAWLWSDFWPEYEDFFKIEAGKERAFEFDPRPETWFEHLPGRGAETGKTDFDASELRESIRDGDLSLFTDKCELEVTMDEVRGIVQPILDHCDEEFREIVVDDFEDELDTYFCDRLIEMGEIQEYPKYNRSLQWIGPVDLDITFDFLLDDSKEPVLVDIGLSTYIENEESHVDVVMELSDKMIDLFLRKRGIMWGFLESVTEKFYFFKMEEGKFLEYPFKGRPDGW